MSTGSSAPAVVVGAGILGLSAALHLRTAQPDREIIVLEAGGVGDGTTPAGAGFVAPFAAVVPYLGASALALSRYSLDFYSRLAADGADIRHRANGNLVFFNREESFTAAVSALAAAPGTAVDARPVSAHEIGDLTSGVVDPSTVAGGVFLPGGIQVETGRVLAHLAHLARDAGIRIMPHTEVRHVLLEDGRLQGLAVTAHPREDGAVEEVIATDLVILAVGAWLNQLLSDVGRRLPLLPFVATRFVTEDVGVPPTLPTMQGKDFPLWIRESEGGFTWGTTVGCAPAHRLGSRWTAFSPGERRYQHLVDAMHADVERVAAVFPSLRGAAVIRTIQGMPVYTADRRFFLGEVPDVRGLWAMGGDNEAGVTHGPGLGRLLADLVTGAEPLCDPTDYRLDRLHPADFADAEAVGQRIAADGPGFIRDAMLAPSALH